MIEEGKKKMEYIVNCETEEGQLGTSQQYQEDFSLLWREDSFCFNTFILRYVTDSCCSFL
jgi:hypothetical protein